MSWSSSPYGYYTQSAFRTSHDERSQPQIAKIMTSAQRLGGPPGYTFPPEPYRLPPLQQYQPMTPHNFEASEQHVRKTSKALKISDLLSPTDDLTTCIASARGANPPEENLRWITGIDTRSTQARHVRPVSQQKRHQTPDFDGFLKRSAEAQILSPASSRSLSREQCSSPSLAGTHSRSPSLVGSDVAAAAIAAAAAAAINTTTTTNNTTALSPFLPQSSPTAATASLVSRRYSLSFRQQPVAARACGHGDRDRRVIDPPPILELKITNKDDDSPSQDGSVMFALHCVLVDAATGQQPVAVQEEEDCRLANSMMGSSAASPFNGKDENGKAGMFFVFSDLSCRYQGHFRLHFTLIRIDFRNMKPGAKHPMVASIKTDIFVAYTAKDFPGMQASTPLLKALRRQGLMVGIKKGSEARKSKSNARRGSSEVDSDSDDSAVKTRPKRRNANASRESSSRTGKSMMHNKSRKRIRINNNKEISA